jgi:hypothetical protein
MARSKKRLQMRQKRWQLKAIRRREQFERAEDEREEVRRKYSGDRVGINESFARLERRRQSERKLIIQTILRIIVYIILFGVVCYAISQLISDMTKG